MGSGIELIRMTIYIFFPVGMFYYFNRPSYYRKVFEENKDLFYPEGNHPPLTFEGNRAELERIREAKRKRLTTQQPPVT